MRPEGTGERQSRGLVIQLFQNLAEWVEKEHPSNLIHSKAEAFWALPVAMCDLESQFVSRWILVRSSFGPLDDAKLVFLYSLFGRELYVCILLKQFWNGIRLEKPILHSALEYWLNA